MIEALKISGKIGLGVFGIALCVMAVWLVTRPCDYWIHASERCW